MFHLAVRRGERSVGGKGNRRAPAAKEKEERGRTGVDRESKVTNAKVIVLLSHPEQIYRVPRDDTLAFPRLEAVEAKKAIKHRGRREMKIIFHPPQTAPS